MSFDFQPIGLIHSCFTEKFGIPRQPGLAPSARGQLELLPPYNDPQALEGLEQCSHLWLQFVFHQPPAPGWKARVRPPRLGGNKSLGVFATRSPLRPNPLGLSVVRLESIERQASKLWLELSGLDLLDQTPVLDIKPYLPYTDALPQAHNGFAEAPPEPLKVVFSARALTQCQQLSGISGQDWEPLVRELLQQDPRPQYQALDPERVYGMSLKGVELRWRYQPDPDSADKPWHIVVLELGTQTPRRASKAHPP